MTVLVVDDAAPIRQRLCGMLSELPGVRCADRAADEELLSYAATVRPDVIVIDVPVHNSRGYARLASLRSMAPDAVLIVLTNHATAEFAARCAALGIDHFLAKAGEFERVVEIVQQLGGAR